MKEAMSYLAYGAVKSLLQIATDKARQKFTGKELDEDGKTVDAEGGVVCAGMMLNYFGARYYDSDVGRWICTDPAGQFEDAYRYTMNPIGHFDPNGLWDERVHYNMTLEWAKKARFTPDQADKIANGDIYTDVGSIGGVLQHYSGPLKSQVRHFNTNTAANGSGQDTRVMFSKDQMQTALSLWKTAKNVDEQNTALFELGYGLHSLQDVDAHTPDVLDEFYQSIGVYGHAKGHPCDDPTKNPNISKTESRSVNYLQEFYDKK